MAMFMVKSFVIQTTGQGYESIDGKPLIAAIPVPPGRGSWWVRCIACRERPGPCSSAASCCSPSTPPTLTRTAPGEAKASCRYQTGQSTAGLLHNNTPINVRALLVVGFELFVYCRLASYQNPH